MTRMSVKAVSAFSFLALAAVPALACDDHTDAAMSGLHGTTGSMDARSMDPAPAAQTPRSTPNTDAYRNIFPDIGFGKWWVGD